MADKTNEYIKASRKAVCEAANTLGALVEKSQESLERLLETQKILDANIEYVNDEADLQIDVVQKALNIVTDIIGNPIPCEIRINDKTLEYEYISKDLRKDVMKEEDGYTLIPKTEGNLPVAMAINTDLKVNEAQLKEKLIRLVSILFGAVYEAKARKEDEEDVKQMFRLSGLTDEEVKEILE